MATIRINDFSLDKKLDRQAMSTVFGGYSELDRVLVSSIKSRPTAQQTVQQIFRQRLEGASRLIGV